MKDVKSVKIWQVLELVKKRIAKNYVDANGDSYREYGICNAVDKCYENITGFYGEHDFDRLSKECFRAWKGYNGSSLYPVEGTMWKFSENHKKWHKCTEYGKRRHDLLDHCIEWFKERDI